MSLQREAATTPRKAGSEFSIHVDAGLADSITAPLPSSNNSSSGFNGKNNVTKFDSTMPLTTSKMENKHSPHSLLTMASKKLDACGTLLREATSPAEPPLNFPAKSKSDSNFKVISKRHESETFENETEAFGHEKTQGVLLDEIRPQIADTNTKSMSDDLEIVRLREQLAAAQSKIAIMDHELNQQRGLKHSDGSIAVAPPSDSGAAGSERSWDPGSLDYPLRESPAIPEDGPSSAASGKQSPASTQFGSGYWNGNSANRSFSAPFDISPACNSMQNNSWNPSETRFSPIVSQRLHNLPRYPKALQLRVSAVESGSNTSGFRNQQLPDSNGQISHTVVNRENSLNGPILHGWNSYHPGLSSASGFSPPMSPLPFGPMNGAPPPQSMPYHPRPIGTPLSPTAMEFNTAALRNTTLLNGNSWNSQASLENNVAYMPPMEPMNYRRLLDKNMSCNWKYIVDKIVCSNDQQASIFLQQKLKVATTEQKMDLIDAIIVQVYPLMINRFGNFLVQRCFEHGTPDQIIAIAKAIRGNTLNLSMDAFGCHVVQKAFDVVPEDYKATMVHELLRRIPETVIHRYACHVWQKLFELRWSDSPPQIMKYVNEALRGMWHEVALGETGSLVVQNIFENCLDEDKRPCINEVLSSIDIISHGQFGNWCIQHICEHGAPPDKSRATEHVLRFATEYSVDQFASKVIEKCLKVGGPEFLERYLEKVCEGRPDRPRMPLIDIAGDQYGNYLIQYVLIHAGSQHRELVATHIRKHMVSLRGSKFGSRVAMLCSNPAFTTRPGPPTGMQVHSRFPPVVNTARSTMGGHFR